MDVHSPNQRSYNMSRVKDKNTRPEILVRKLLWSNGYRNYRLHYKDLPGKPDIVFLGRRKAIFINGCFWHKHECRYFKWPDTNSEFWKRKIRGNVERDGRRYALLIDRGWDYFIVWECETKEKNYDALWSRIHNFLNLEPTGISCD